MRSIPASEAKQNFAAMLDAAQREPLVICRHNREVAVLISMQDYEGMKQPAADSPPPARRHAPLSMSEQLLAQLLADEDSGNSSR